jgi:hypothetical protein
MVKASDGTSTDGRPMIEVLYESSDRDYQVEVYQENCETSTDVFSKQESRSDSDKDGFMDVNVGLTIDQDKLEDSPLWDGSGFSFCMGKSLLAPDETVVTKKYTIFRVSVDNQAGFSINGIAVEEGEVEEENLSMTYKGSVTAFQCDENTYFPVDGEVLGPFDTLNVCVEVVEAEEPGVVVSGVQDLTITQDGTGVTFLALQNGETDENFEDLVDTKCNSEGICMVRVQLINAFFSDPQLLNVDGVAILGGSSRKLTVPVVKASSSLRGGKKEERNLQDNEEEDDNKFKLKVGVSKPCQNGEGSSILSKMIKGQS